MKRVYCLYRVSTKKQIDVDKNDIPMQSQACRDFASRQDDWQIIKEFEEKGVSGYKKSAAERNVLQELLKSAQNGEFDILLVYKGDRLGRREDETPSIVKGFVELGVEVWSTVEGQYKCDNVMDRVFNHFRFAQAEMESENTSIRIKTRMHQLTAEGVYIGGVTPFGYRRVKSGKENKKGQDIYMLAIDDAEADVVRLIFDKTVKEGYGSFRMADFLNNLGIKTHNGNKFKCNTVNRILKNKIYCGYFKLGETVSPHLPELQIVDEEKFNAAQHILEQRSVKNEKKQHIARTTKGKTLLSGNIYCAHCGSHLSASSYYEKYTLVDGKKVGTTKERYVCYHKTRKLNDCTGQSVYVAARIDKEITDLVKNYLNRIKDVPQEKALKIQYEKQLKEQKAKLKQLQSLMQKKENQLKELSVEVAKALTGESKIALDVLSMSIDTVKNEIAQFSTQINDCEAALNNKADVISKLEYYYSQFKGWASEFDTATPEQKKMIICQLFKEIRVGRGYKIDVEMNISYQQFFAI